MVRLQASDLRLAEDELSLLRRDGFVISDRKRTRTFGDGWLAVYKADLPLFVTADALLHALHRSYDAVLRTLEQQTLAAQLEAMLLGMRARLAEPGGASLSPTTVADIDLLTTVALRLLEKENVAPVVASDEGAIAEMVDRVGRAGGRDSATLFGRSRDVDWSQFKPRGHYAGPGGVRLSGPRKIVTLADYFRAAMWLGRTDVRIAVVQGGTYRLVRRQLDLAYGLRAVMGAPELSTWNTLEATMNAFVGGRDEMGVTDVDRLSRDLNVKSAAELALLPEAKVLAAVMTGHYGEQRIRSQLSPGDDAHPGLLDRTFSLTGQRATPDARAMSDLVYDLVQDRLMPDPLDVAYTVLGNDDAKALLAPEIALYTRRPALGPALAAARSRADAAGPGFWDASLYTLWLGAIRGLSPAPDVRLPPAVAVQAWGRRILSTQLASWAEMRHDTLLYAKQSYTGGILCSYPDAFVDPYPAFYERLSRLAEKGRALVAALDMGAAGSLRARIDAYFDHFARTMARLGRIAQGQAGGAALAADDLAFVNGAISEDPPKFGGCGPPPRVVRGWYVDLYFDQDPLAFAPTIADVHTQPDDPGGTPVGNVLHVGTAQPRLIVLNGGDRDHVRPYVGSVSMFTQAVMKNFQRETDEEWFRQVFRDNPEDVAWMRDLVVR